MDLILFVFYLVLFQMAITTNDKTYLRANVKALNEKINDFSMLNSFNWISLHCLAAKYNAAVAKIMKDAISIHESRCKGFKYPNQLNPFRSSFRDIKNLKLSKIRGSQKSITLLLDLLIVNDATAMSISSSISILTNPFQLPFSRRAPNFLSLFAVNTEVKFSKPCSCKNNSMYRPTKSPAL